MLAVRQLQTSYARIIEIPRTSLSPPYPVAKLHYTPFEAETGVGNII